jgi:hypothetical protein
MGGCFKSLFSRKEHKVLILNINTLCSLRETLREKRCKTKTLLRQPYVFFIF